MLATPRMKNRPEDSENLRTPLFFLADEKSRRNFMEIPLQEKNILGKVIQKSYSVIHGGSDAEAGTRHGSEKARHRGDRQPQEDPKRRDGHGEWSGSGGDGGR